MNIKFQSLKYTASITVRQDNIVRKSAQTYQVLMWSVCEVPKPHQAIMGTEVEAYLFWEDASVLQWNVIGSNETRDVGKPTISL